VPAVTQQGAPKGSTNRVIDSDSAVQCVWLPPMVNARKLSVHWKISRRLKTPPPCTPIAEHKSCIGIQIGYSRSSPITLVA
jgi:hypothetical protein